MGRFEITHVTAIPAGVSKEKAVSVLHDTENYFKAADSYKDHKVLEGGDADKIPADIKAKAQGALTAWLVHNEVPNPVFDSNVKTSYTVANVDDGLFYYASSPMGVTNEARWTVKEANGGLELTLSIFVECNMMLKPVVKGQVEVDSKKIASALVARMQ